MLVRKVNGAKWRRNDLSVWDNVSADAITHCLKTNCDTLSTWKINSQDDINEAVLAIVSAGDFLEAFDVIPLEAEHLKANGIDSLKTVGDTPIIELRDQHFNLTDLSYKKLGIIANHIIDQINKDKMQRYTFGKLKSILQSAIHKGRLSSSGLANSIQNKLET